jgi:HK97 gp10 family phage protein
MPQPIMESYDSFAQVRLLVRGVLKGKGALAESLGVRMDQLVSIIEKTTIKSFPIFGERIVKAAKENIESSHASGRKYTYVEVNEDGETVKVGEHTSSKAGDFPSSYSGKLRDAITYRVRTSVMGVEVGVYSDALGGEFPTSYFAGSKYVDSGEGIGDDGEVVSNVVVVDQEKGKRTQIQEYAKYLTEGTSKMAARPFLGPALESELPELRKEFRETLRDEVRKKFRRKGLPIHFVLIPKRKRVARVSAG